MQLNNMKYTNIFLAMLAVVLISGCASGGVTNTRGEDVTDLQETFKKGEVRLQCGLGCSGKWGANIRAAKHMHDNGLWKDLIAVVTNIGFSEDLTYYYLGRAAEGEGYKDAAIEYYKQALAAKKCGKNVRLCGEFVFPRDIEYRLSIVQGLETEKPTQSVAPPVQTLPVSAPSIKSTPTEVPPPELTAAERRQSEISNKIKKDFDEFKKITNYKGPEESWGNCDSIFLRAWKSDTEKEAAYQIYVMDYYSGGLCPRTWCKSRSGSHGLRHGWHANQTVTADRLTTGLSPTSAKVSRVM